jgi:HEAT repeat protein
MSPDELLAALSKTRLLRGPHAFSFPNLAIQEFLTAHALQSRNTHEILELIAPAEWTLIPSVDSRPHNLRRGAFHGALPFLSGMLEDSSALIEGLLDRDLVLASECYREARYAHRATASLQPEIQRALASTGEIQQQIGCLSLEALGDAWAVKLLERAASDGEFPSRALALSALGSLRSYGSVPLLQSAAKEKDPDVARAAQDALARIKAS